MVRLDYFQNKIWHLKRLDSKFTFLSVGPDVRHSHKVRQNDSKDGAKLEAYMGGKVTKPFSFVLS